MTANFEPITYTITYTLNGGTATNPANYTVETDTFTLVNPTRTGYTFKGWSGTQLTGDENKAVSIAKGSTGNREYTANWNVNDYVLTFDLNGGTAFGGWQGEVQNSDTQTKAVTFGERMNKADSDGKTWPNDPVKEVAVTDGTSIYADFQGWYTEANGGTRIEAGDTVLLAADQTVYARFETVVVEQTREQLDIVIEHRNANDYTMESMLAVDAVMQDILDSGREITQDDLDRLEEAMAQLEPVTSEGTDGGDMTPPTLSVYENKAALQKAIADGTFHGDQEDIDYMLSSETGETSYVYPGKAYYTYYCYTSSAQPAIMLSAKDVLGESGRVSYPVTFAMDETGTNSLDQVRTRSGLVESGWMNYTQDPTDPEAEGYNANRSADWKLGKNKIANPYRTQLKYFGMDYAEGEFSQDKDYNYYTHEEYILLKPKFEIDGGKQYALYTFQVRDDSISSLAPDTATLAGAEGSALVETNLDTISTNANITPAGTVTVYVEYYNTMNGHDGDAGGQTTDANGVGTYNDDALEVYNGFRENGYENNVWVNKDYLYRNAAGAANGDFIAPNFAENGVYPEYVANDPVYGQTDVGSFYYLMKSDDAATTLYWNAYDKYIDDNPNDNDVYHNARVAGAQAALGVMQEKVAKDMQDSAIRAKMLSTPTQSAHVSNGDYIYWPYTANTRWSTMFYAPARTREDTLVYVHIYDRWGNHYTNILQRDLQDTQVAAANVTTRGEVTINELGGSGIQGISIYELNTKKQVNVGGMTDDQAWNVENNRFTITGLPQGSNDYGYTMTITDNAGSDQTVNFRADENGCVTVVVNDENMGGKYAAAAAVPTPETQTGAQTNGVSVGGIEEAPLTTIAIEEVDPDEIKIDTIPDALLNGDAAAEEERPDVYTFTLNEVYTVNLFADTARDYEMSLRSTAGGVVKAYVNGEFSPAKSGKIVIPAGSQVQIRVSVKAGYELQSLTMQYSDGRTINLVGAYNAEINDDVTVKAIFRQTDALVTVHVENGAVSGKQEMHVSPYSRVAVVADAAPEGKVFAYWAQNGEDDVPVSYDEIYTFIATSNVDMKAIYADAPTARTASVAMDAPSETHVMVVNGAYTLSYSGKITLPEDVQIEEFGMVLTNRSADSCTAENFVIGGSVGGTNVVKLVGQTLTNEGQCKINVNNVKPGQTRTGRLYMVVRLADGTTQTIYSNTWSELNTPAA